MKKYNFDPIQTLETEDFAHIGGMEEPKRIIREGIIMPMMYPNIHTSIGVKKTRGVLLCGPPGSGKTLLAKSIAREFCKAGIKASFFCQRGPELLSKYFGETEKNLRYLFHKAQHMAPSVILFDEIDSVCPRRNMKHNQVYNSVVSTLLSLMDGLDGMKDVFVVGTTTRPDNIDEALRRPGRFDREIYCEEPDARARRQILEIQASLVNIEDKTCALQ